MYLQKMQELIFFFKIKSILFFCATRKKETERHTIWKTGVSLWLAGFPHSGLYRSSTVAQCTAGGWRKVVPVCLLMTSGPPTLLPLVGWPENLNHVRGGVGCCRIRVANESVFFPPLGCQAVLPRLQTTDYRLLQTSKIHNVLFWKGYNFEPIKNRQTERCFRLNPKFQIRFKINPSEPWKCIFHLKVYQLPNDQTLKRQSN